MHSVHIIYKLFDCNFDIPIYIFDITYIYIYIYETKYSRMDQVKLMEDWL